MKVAKLYNFNDIRIENIPIPEIGSGDALMKTKASGICSGDVMQWYIEKKAPLVLGHEPAGEIVELGSSLVTRYSSLSVGDRVSPHHHAPCLTCRYCRRGDHVQCETWKNTKIIPGGISEYILIPEINLKNDTLKLPENLSFEDGTLIEPTACVLKGLKRAGLGCKSVNPTLPPLKLRGGKVGLLSDRTVLVIGLGVMGQLDILIAKRFGAGRIIGADMVPYRLKKAKEFGADEVIDVSKENLLEALRKLTDGNMADLVIVGPNSVEAMKKGIHCAGAGGIVLFFTPAKPGEMLTLDPNHLYFHDINIVTSYSCGPDDTKEALRLIEEGVVRAEKLVTHRFPIEKTAEAFRLVAEAKESLKVVRTFCDVAAGFSLREPEIVNIFTDILTSVVAKTGCIVPVYCFMPDHQHLIITGIRSNSDIWKTMVSYKQKTGFWMAMNKIGISWQKDFYDHIIRRHKEIAVQVRYILDNPVRKRLESSWQEYPFKGSIGCKLEDVLNGII